MTATHPRPRYRPIDRDLISPRTLDEQLPEDDPVRAIWAFTCGLDFAAFDRDVRAVDGRPGRPAYDCRLLFALWLFALIDGVCHARELARRCVRDLPYRWLCGGLEPDYHTLSDFHAQHHDRLRELFIAHVAALRAQGLIELTRVALDGTKRPGCAGSATYHRQPTLQKHLAEAEEHWRAWEQARVDTTGCTARQLAARRRAARERRDRVQQALEQVQVFQDQRRAARRPDAQPEEARASEADPDAVRMKQGDGGYRIGYNVQTVTDATLGLVVTTAVINQANDAGQLRARLEQVKQEQRAQPGQALVDTGYATLDDIQWAEECGIQVFMPPRQTARDRRSGADPYQAKKGDSAERAAWRARMGTPAAQQVYNQRAALAEIIHARMAQRRWFGFRLRGLAKVAAEGLWQALAHNVGRLLALGRLVGTAVRAD